MPCLGASAWRSSRRTGDQSIAVAVAVYAHAHAYDHEDDYDYPHEDD